MGFKAPCESSRRKDEDFLTGAPIYIYKILDSDAREIFSVKKALDFF